MSNHDKMLLAQSTQEKVKWLEEILENNNTGLWVAMTKILLDYPVSEGGLPTELIESIYNKHKEKIKNQSNSNHLKPK